LGPNILGFLDNEFRPWPDDLRDEERFATGEDQYLAAEMQPDLLDWTGGDVLWFPSQTLLPEAWNRYASPRSGWRTVPDDPRVEDVRGAIFAPSDLLLMANIGPQAERPDVRPARLYCDCAEVGADSELRYATGAPRRDVRGARLARTLAKDVP
jgi:hypothetical protein